MTDPTTPTRRALTRHSDRTLTPALAQARPVIALPRNTTTTAAATTDTTPGLSIASPSSPDTAPHPGTDSGPARHERAAARTVRETTRAATHPNPATASPSLTAPTAANHQPPRRTRDPGPTSPSPPAPTTTGNRQPATVNRQPGYQRAPTPTIPSPPAWTLRHVHLGLGIAPRPSTHLILAAARTPPENEHRLQQPTPGRHRHAGLRFSGDPAVRARRRIEGQREERVGLPRAELERGDGLVVRVKPRPAPSGVPSSPRPKTENSTSRRSANRCTATGPRL
jgi:hypothetical protein